MGNEVIQLISEIVSWLEDKESKDVFLARMNWLMTGDYRYIEDIVHKYHPELGGALLQVRRWQNISMDKE